MPFLYVAKSRCSSGHPVWDVIWADGTEDRLHHGLWPMYLSEAQQTQLTEA